MYQVRSLRTEPAFYLWLNKVSAKDSISYDIMYVFPSGCHSWMEMHPDDITMVTNVLSLLWVLQSFLHNGIEQHSSSICVAKTEHVVLTYWFLCTSIVRYAIFKHFVRGEI